MTPDWDMVMHLAEAAAMIIFGVGAWSAQRKAGETTNATDISKLATSIGEIKLAIDAKLGWKDFDRISKAERQVTDLQIKNVEDRVEAVEGRIERIDRKVFNGGHRG
jgi:hypothetical protein